MQKIIFPIPIFRPGMTVRHKGRESIVESVVIVKQQVMVKLNDEPKAVCSEKLHCEPTLFVYDPGIRQ